MRLLIVEDDPELVLLMRHFLDEVREVEAVIVECTDSAIGLLDDGYKPACALVDFSAKGRATSVDLCRRLASVVPGCKVHLMSGVGVSLMKTATKGLGNIGRYIEKPFSVTDVVSGIVGDDLFLRSRSEIERSSAPVRREETVCGSSSADGSYGPGTCRGTASVTDGVDDHATAGQRRAVARLLEEDPNDPAARQVLAFSLYLDGRYRDALKEYDRVASLCEPGYLCLYYHGHTCARLHLFRDAIKLWQRALNLAPDKEAAAKIRMRISQAEDMHRMERKLRDTDPRRKSPGRG